MAKWHGLEGLGCHGNERARGLTSYPHGASDTIMLKCEQKKCIVWLILSTSSLFQSPGTQWIFVTSKTQGDGRSRVLPVKGCGINITVVGGRNVERKR